jgi:hypothetical protein
MPQRDEGFGEGTQRGNEPREKRADDRSDWGNEEG